MAVKGKKRQSDFSEMKRFGMVLLLLYRMRRKDPKDGKAGKDGRR